MADLGIVQRRGFLWLWWLAAVLAVAGLVWLAASRMEGRAADLELDMDAGGAAGETAPP